MHADVPRLAASFLVSLVVSLAVASSFPAGAETNPYERQTAEHVERLASPEASVRAGAAEALGFLRAYSAAGELVKALGDKAPSVRREAAMALGWCGERREVVPLLEVLGDGDWTVRQAAWVALTNLTGMELPFDALDERGDRDARAGAWREWWAAVPADSPPGELLALLPHAPPGTPDGNLALSCPVAVSTAYKGPPGVLTDGETVSGFWQTKNVAFPQHCTVDLGEAREVACVVVHQYGSGFCMTEWDVSTSLDGETYETVRRGKKRTSPRLVVTFDAHRARYVRVTSHGTERPIYPTTFREIEVTADGPPPPPPPRDVAAGSGPNDERAWRIARGMRALGVIGGEGASRAVADALRGRLAAYRGRPAESAAVQAGIRSLGRLRDPETLPFLTGLLVNPQWARYAADALGDFGGERAAAALIGAYPRYARDLRRGKPKAVPRDDRPGFEPVDRMYETAYAIASALARLPLSDEKNLAALREIAPVIAANLPGDFDGAMLYEEEAGQLVTAHLLERAGLRRAACEAALAALGASTWKPRGRAHDALAQAAKGKAADCPYAATWLPAFCREAEDVPRLVRLLEHGNGWVRINAAKALMFMGSGGVAETEEAKEAKEAKEAAGPIARLLARSKPEAEHGYNGRYMYRTSKRGQDELDDPPPRWREAFVRALGRLGRDEHAPLLVKMLFDERNALEIQHAAALALDEMGLPDALEALARAETAHPYHSIRLVAREARWRRGLASPGDARARADPPRLGEPPPAPVGSPAIGLEAVVFIKGDNVMPNNFQIDIWRQTYSTTDSGPTYRLGRDLYLLRPARRGGEVTPLTRFKERGEGGYVADCEVSWDGRRIVFARRGADSDPWWHICEVKVDGTGLRQITRGPYHDVQPAYLPDGRIVFSTTRIGMRDEYHGYLATGLAVMSSDGTGIRCIGFNLGRDDEPAVLADGRIVFGRLELFYSRLKTERTLHAVFPDGTRDVTLYGPERRDLWRGITRASGEKWWGEAPPRHRVLRMTQPQQFGEGRVICATTGGATIVGPGRYRETVLPRYRNMAVTSPFPLPSPPGNGRVLCAATVREFKRGKVDLGLYIMDGATGELELLYNDPATAEFEPRPIMSRRRPPVLSGDDGARGKAYTARLLCRSVRTTQEPRVAALGKYVRIIEGMPVTGRHQTHRSRSGEAWKNHTGTLARVLGTVPLAADGSFYVEVPADRLVHVQVLDSDRRTVGNQLIWMYARPGETRSCIGCHERPDTAPPSTHSASSGRARGFPPAGGFPQAAMLPPVKCLPTGSEFTYRAKLWQKGRLPDEGEERTRTVRAVNLIGRQ